ncbi:toll/interleukin-1 receptor domain-containing protein [Streptomyces acidiscabies]|uniref:toll/interleukin-1 receptor domain-containing protein n=1 Tax=Streptomyces acidiscabies TaxID=42234 RepID=UPI000951D7CD|nr:toll/interleukin-1 receptor domain-containing protein [Streptomyces acidiscabies]
MDRSVNYFYTSCTQADGWPSLSRFHADLEYRLKAQEGLWVAGVLGPQTGSGPVLERGVTRVGVLVALYSRHYFQDRDCGLEWSVFQRRVRSQEFLTDQPLADCVIPLLWNPETPYEPPEGIPAPWPFLAELDGAGSEAGQLYEDKGLSGLMQSQLPEAADLYVALLGLLARRIAKAQGFRLAPLEGDELRTVTPAFGTTPAPERVSRTVPGGDLVTHGSGNGGYLRYSDVGHRGSARLRSVAISYVGADQPWADWIQEVLEEGPGTATVHQVRWRTELEPLSEAVARARAEGSRVVVVFSRSYFTAGAPDPYQWEEVFIGPDAADLIPVQIDTEPRPLLVRRGVQVAQLAGSDEGQAQRLRDMVGDAGPTVPGQREGDAR